MARCRPEVSRRCVWALTSAGRMRGALTIGAALLGWVAGEMAFSDPAIIAWTESHHNLHLIPPVLCALLVVSAGKYLQEKH